MANKFTEQRLIDSNKRTLIKLTGILDTEMNNVTVVDVSTLAFALNTSNQIMSSNTNPKSTYDVTVKRVIGDININGLLKLQWHGASNTEMLVLGPDTYDLDLDKDGINAVITNNETSSLGDILISTVGATSNNSYSIILDLRKNSRDYDAGQTRDPVAFNRGVGAM